MHRRNITTKDNQIGRLELLQLTVAGEKLFSHEFKLEMRVAGEQEARGRLDLVSPDVLTGIEELPVEVTQVNRVWIDETQALNSRSRQSHGNMGSYSAHADNHDSLGTRQFPQYAVGVAALDVGVEGELPRDPRLVQHGSGQGIFQANQPSLSIKNVKQFVGNVSLTELFFRSVPIEPPDNLIELTAIR